MKPPMGTAYGAVLTLTLAFGSLAAAQTAQPYAAVTAAMPQVQFNFRVTLIPVPGRVQQVTASLKLDPLRPQNVTGTVQVPLKTLMTGIGVYYPDGRETQRVGLAPDVAVRPTIAGLRAGRDELRDRAVELITQAPKQSN